MKAVLFAYHDIGCEAIKTLMDLDQDVAAVFTHRDDPDENVWFGSVEETAKSFGIPVFTPDSPNTEKWIRKIKYIAPDLLLSFYYRHLITDDILKIPAMGALNLHGSLLPKYRGRAPVNWALVNGEKETGLTLHHMVARADAGDIVAQKKIPIGREDTALTLFRKLVPLTRKILTETVPLLEKGEAPRIPQNEALATVFKGRKPEDGRIDWTRDAEEIYNLVRAVTRPYPGAFSFLDGKKVLVWKAQTAEKQGKPGTILNLNPLTVACGKEALVLEEIEPQIKVTTEMKFQ